MLLAFDTATPQVTVAVWDGVEVIAEHASAESLRHGEQLAPLIARCLDDAGTTPHELTGVAVGVGPGPFTGLRVGLVTARTLGFALGIGVHGVCTLDVLAAEAAAGEGLGRDFRVATDARRKEVYLASYDANGRRVAGPTVLRPDAASGDDPVVGEGAALYPDAFPDARAPLLPSAAWLARVVVERRAELLTPEPLYLRRPDAARPGPPKPVS